MTKTRFTFKSWCNFFATIFAWATFVILILIAMFLLYYFICSNRYQVMGKGFEPPFSIYTIVSPSMTPTIKVYDVIINTKVSNPASIQEGDVITFISTSAISQGKTVTHRVTDVQIIDGNYQYTTKGDNNISEDIQPALYENVIGKTEFKLPQLGRIQFFVASKMGWLFVIIVPACWIIIGDIIKIAKLSRIKKNAQRQNENTVNSVNNQTMLN